MIPQHIYELLVKLMGTNDPVVINQWWTDPNPSLENGRPVDINTERVVQYLMELVD